MQSMLNATHQTTLFNLPASSLQPKSSVTSIKKLDTKTLGDSIHLNFVYGSESEHCREGGCKILPLLQKISQPCHPVADENKNFVCRFASKGCHTTGGWPCDRTHILKHVAACGYLVKMEGGDLVQQAIQELARKEPDLVNKLMKNMGIAPEVKCPHDNLMEITGDAPPLKHSQTEPLINKPHADNSAASDITISAGLPMKTFQLEWKKST